MKANELIHGGLYLIHDTSDIVVRYDITSNSFRSEWYEYPLALFHDDVCATDGDRYIFVKPIPITEEILKANGFEDKSEKARYGNVFYGFTTGNVSITFEVDNGLPILTIEDTADRSSQHNIICLKDEIYNVHELQHALRLCGLNSLADNLKIK